MAVVIGVTSGMAQTPQTPPALFDRALLHARQRRAHAQGEVTFLLDRVAEDMTDRLAAVMREFHAAADLWTPGVRGSRGRHHFSGSRSTKRAWKNCPLPRKVSISSSRHWRCNSSTTCRGLSLIHI